MVRFVKGALAWKQSGELNHVFVLSSNGDSVEVSFFDLSD